MPRSYAGGRLAAAIAVSVAVVLSAPFIGQLRAALRAAAGASFVPLMASVVGGLVVLATLSAAIRIRTRRVPRYGALLIALIVGLGYAFATRTGNPEVDAVERVHFLEYGVISLLFYRAWKPAGDGSVIVMPLLWGLLVGTFEEWLQWFIPARIGEARDILLNLVAISCGLLFSLALDPPDRPTLALTPASRRRVAVVAGAAIVVFGAFFHSVHLGHEIKDGDAGVFRSRYTADDLGRLADARARQWRDSPPLTWSRLSREDQYFSEGVAHVRRRNEAWAEGNVLAARYENLILEKYYAPVLDTPSYVSAQGHRWPDAQRADAESRIGAGFMIYVSDAIEYPIVIWPKWMFWSAIALFLAVVLRRVGRPA